MHARRKTFAQGADEHETIRPEVDAAFSEMATTINILYYANELVAKNEEMRTTLGALIDKINSYIVELDEVVSRRTGSSTTEIPDGGDEPTPEPVTPESPPSTKRGRRPGKSTPHRARQANRRKV